MTLLPEKALPHDVKLEEGILGAILLEKSAFGKVREYLDYTDFYKEEHNLIFRSCMTLFESVSPIDLLTVTDQLRKENNLDHVGGAYYITTLTTAVNSASHIEKHSLILKELSLRRKLIKTGLESYNYGFDNTKDVFESIEISQQKLNNLLSFNGLGNAPAFDELLFERLKHIEAVMKHLKPLTGIKTGLKNIDDLIGYISSTDLCILAARPGMGKSALALKICLNQIKYFDTPCLLFSLEMSTEELLNRLLSMESRVALTDIRFSNKLSPHQFNLVTEAAERLGELNCNIIDDCFTFSQMKGIARKFVEEKKVKLIVVDYLQLINVGNTAIKMSNREGEIAYISRNLKKLAKELDVPVIALSQLSRAVEQRGGDKRPRLSDLRESGSIEQDADMVAFLFRPEYYGILQDEQGISLPPGYTECIIAKHRNGSIGKADLIFHDYRTDFTDAGTYESKMSVNE